MIISPWRSLVLLQVHEVDAPRFATAILCYQPGWPFGLNLLPWRGFDLGLPDGIIWGRISDSSTFGRWLIIDGGGVVGMVDAVAFRSLVDGILFYLIELGQDLFIILEFTNFAG